MGFILDIIGSVVVAVVQNRRAFNIVAARVVVGTNGVAGRLANLEAASNDQAKIDRHQKAQRVFMQARVTRNWQERRIR